MTSTLHTLFLVLLAAHANCYEIKSAPLLTERPSWLKICQKSDPELGVCFNEMLMQMFPHLATGIPEMNVDPFEPLPLDSVSVTKGIGPVTLTGSLYDMIVVGPSNATATYTEVDLKNNKIVMGLHLPILDIKSEYDLKGKILVLPIIGNGRCHLDLEDVNTKVTTDISFPKVEGKEVLRFDKMHVAFKVKGMKVHFDNLFNGNKVLGRTMNNFLNQNSIEVITELEENIGENLAVIFTDLINNVFMKIPTELWLQNNNTNSTESDVKKS